jgi:hypothetical protein
MQRSQWTEVRAVKKIVFVFFKLFLKAFFQYFNEARRDEAQSQTYAALHSTVANQRTQTTRTLLKLLCRVYVPGPR